MTSLTQNKEEKDWHPDGKRAKEINGHFRIKRMYKQPKNIGKSAPPFQSSEEDKLKPQIPLDTCQKCKNERQKISSISVDLEQLEFSFGGSKN